MRAYKWSYIDRGQFLVIPDARDRSRVIVKGMRGDAPMVSDWRPPGVELVTHDESGALLVPTDILAIYTDPALSGLAVTALGDYLSRFGEILPLRSEDGEYYVYNVTNLVDALDEVASDIARFPDGRIMTVTHFVLRSDAVRDAGVFRLPQLPRHGPFLTQRAADLIAASGCVGLQPYDGAPGQPLISLV